MYRFTESYHFLHGRTAGGATVTSGRMVCGLSALLPAGRVTVHSHEMISESEENIDLFLPQTTQLHDLPGSVKTLRNAVIPDPDWLLWGIGLPAADSCLQLQREVIE
jgi:hypothetical protein